MRQTSLLAAGCQPWNRDVCAASHDRFAYCATLAVYIYQLDRVYSEFKLLSIVAEHHKTITALAWHPTDPDLFATSGADSRIIVWNVAEQRVVASLESVRATPTSLGWSMVDKSRLAFCSGRGPVVVWNFEEADSTVPHKEALNFVSNVTLFRWHRRKLGKLVTGHVNGSLSFFSVGHKCAKHVLRPEVAAEYDEDDPVVGLEWDPLSVDYLLVINDQGGIRMVDSEALSVVMTFVLPSTATSVCTMAWVPTAPGMFVSGDAHQGVLRLWNVSKATPIVSLKLKTTGFHSLCVFSTSPHGSGDYTSLSTDTGSLNSPNSGSSNHASSTSQAIPARRSEDRQSSYTLPPGHAVCTFEDGGVGLYDLKKRQWDFLRELGHIETIFDCKFKPENPDLLATASFDGTMKVWDIKTLTAVESSPGNEGIIYSISWAPADLNCVMAGTSRNGAFIWDIGQNKIIKRYTEHGGASIYSVAWCQKDSRRLASCGADNFCVIREIDGKLLQKYRHPAAVFGCDWSPNNKDMLATGCGDGAVRIYYIATSSDQPLKSFTGHTAKVFHVRWSPLRDGILCSGSDDGTIRIWDYTQESCVNILVGHKANVRGLMWNPEIPYLLISGSWDYTIRVWDTRDGACIDQVLDHGADVYGLTMHPNRPFVLASCSRDSTVRIWSLMSLVVSSQMRIIARRPWQEIVTATDQAMAVRTLPLMCGRASRDLKSRIDHYRGNVDHHTILRWFSNLFSCGSGTANLWELVSILDGQDDCLLPDMYSQGIMHIKHLIKFKSSEAKELEMAKVRGQGSSYRAREEKVREAAMLHMKLGEVQRYSELMVELGEWEKALSVAPAVSLDYWKELAERYAASLAAGENLECVPYYIVTGNVQKLVNFYCDRGQLQDALLVAQVASEGALEERLKSGIANGRMIASDGQGRINGYEQNGMETRKLQISVTEQMAAKFFQNGSPILAACCHLASGQIKLALSKLIRGHELELAVSIGKALKGEAHVSLVAMALELLSHRCESQGHWELAIHLLEDIPDDHDLKVKLCARCVGSAAEINHMHEKAGLPPLEECSQKAKHMLDIGNLRECVCYYLLSPTPEEALSIALPKIRSCFCQPDWVVEDVFPLLQLLGCIRSDRLMMQSVAQLKEELLILSFYVGAMVAIRRGYTSVVIPLLSLTQTLLRQSKGGPDIPLSDATLQTEIEAWKAVRAGHDMSCQTPVPPPTSLQEGIYQTMVHRGQSMTLDLEMGEDFVTGSHLPSHSDVHRSLFSASRIQGPAFFLEDSRSVISLNDALMWSKVTPFSPLGTGALINPF
ncbi:WD repeat-containing protein 17-like [Diadema setosum]|uniref:WD repeat-containing protein 17-like n=1 Tax=Diadema setosum TaxID=31175 RepID=UPI003B3BD407